MYQKLGAIQTQVSPLKAEPQNYCPCFLLHCCHCIDWLLLLWGLNQSDGAVGASEHRMRKRESSGGHTCVNICTTVDLIVPKWTFFFYFQFRKTKIFTIKVK